MKRTLWILLIIAVLTSLLVACLPFWLIQPFRPQTASAVDVAYTLRRIGPIFTILSAISALILLLKLWKNSSTTKRVLVFSLMLITIGAAWFARQNQFEWMFHPLPNPSYARVQQANFLQPADMVLAIEINQDAVAYPVRFLAYHHLVQDVVGGQPVVATY